MKVCYYISVSSESKCVQKKCNSNFCENITYLFPFFFFAFLLFPYLRRLTACKVRHVINIVIVVVVVVVYMCEAPRRGHSFQ